MEEAVCLDVQARWFAGKGRAVAAITCADRIGPLALVDVAYADGGGAERYLLTPADPAAWAPLLRRVAAGPLHGATGRLELRRGPAWDALAGALDGAAAVPSTDQTNTLATFGDRLLVKAYRRLEAGTHPEVEVLAALAGAGAAAPVPAFAGSLHHVPDDGGPATALALLQEFVPGTLTGWESPILAVAEVLRATGGRAGAPGRGARTTAAPAAVDLDAAAAIAAAAAPYREAGRAVARLHAALAAALPTRTATRADRDAWRAEAEATLREAGDGDEAFARAAGEIRARLAALGAGPAPLLTRIHGDLHHAQLLRAPGRVLVIDFEGDPTRPLAARRALDTPLRDLACLLRSIDHIGSAAARRVGWAPPDTWIAAARAQALAGYAERAPAPVDHALLHALELAKECGEAVYARRVLPAWAYVARRGLARLLAHLPAPGTAGAGRAPTTPASPDATDDGDPTTP